MWELYANLAQSEGKEGVGCTEGLITQRLKVIKMLSSMACTRENLSKTEKKLTALSDNTKLFLKKWN